MIIPNHNSQIITYLNQGDKLEVYYSNDYSLKRHLQINSNSTRAFGISTALGLVALGNYS